MKKSEFIEGYCKRSGITERAFHEYQVALPCACEGDGCEGWAAIGFRFIEDHLRFSAPEDIAKYYYE